MKPSERIVTRIPLTSLWDTDGELALDRGPRIGCERVRELLRCGLVTFYVANVGKSLRRIPSDETFEFWKVEAKPRLVEPEASDRGFLLESFPDERCYVGSEWSGAKAGSVILLEMYH